MPTTHSSIFIIIYYSLYINIYYFILLVFISIVIQSYLDTRNIFNFQANNNILYILKYMFYKHDFIIDIFYTSIKSIAYKPIKL